MARAVEALNSSPTAWSLGPTPSGGHYHHHYTASNNAGVALAVADSLEDGWMGVESERGFYLYTFLYFIFKASLKKNIESRGESTV